MKKTKLLIPALSIASVGAIVTPITTACNKNSIEMFDMKKEYTPSITPYTPKEGEEGGVDKTTAQSIYIREIKNNPTIIKDDFLKGRVVKDKPDIKKFNLGIRVDKVYDDGRVDCEIVSETKIESTDESVQIDMTSKFICNKVNVNVEIDAEAEEDKWEIVIVDIDDWETWADDTNVKLICKGTYKTSDSNQDIEFTCTGKEVTVNKTFIPTDLEDLCDMALASEIIGEMGALSYFLKDLKVSKQK